MSGVPVGSQYNFVFRFIQQKPLPDTEAVKCCDVQFLDAERGWRGSARPEVDVYVASHPLTTDCLWEHQRIPYIRPTGMGVRRIVSRMGQ